MIFRISWICLLHSASLKRHTGKVFILCVEGWEFDFGRQKLNYTPPPPQRSPFLIRYSSKTAEQNISWNFQELFTTWCHTAPPVLNFYPHDFGVYQSKTRTLPLQHMGDPSLIRYSSWTAEQNSMKLSGIIH